MTELYLNAIKDKKTGHIITQTPLPPIKYLVLEGGGVRGTAYAGMFNVLNKHGFFKGIEHVAASSVGSIAAIFLALGYSAEEAQEELSRIPLKEFLEGSEPWAYTPTVFSNVRKALTVFFSKTNSLSSGKILYEWLQHIVAKKFDGNKFATLEDLEKKVTANDNQHRDYPYRYLHMMATDISKPVREGFVFNHSNAAKAPIALGALASGAFPTAFPKVEWNGHSYVDGGITNNLPCEIFDAKCYLIAGYPFTEKGKNPCTLAIKIDTQDEINQLIWGSEKTIDLSSGQNYLTRVAIAGTESVNVAEIREARQVLPLPDKNIDTLDFTIDDEGKINLVTSAEKVSQEFLENMVDAVYDINVYPNQRAWLDSLAQDDIANLINRYQLLAKNYKQCPEKKEINDDSTTYTLAEIKDYITYLRKYYRFRHHKALYPRTSFNATEPTFINLPIKKATDNWEASIKKDMQHRLAIAEKYINITDQKIRNDRYELQEYYEDANNKSLHDESLYEKIKVLTGYMEYKKVLEEERLDLQKKLNCKKSKVPDYSPNPHYSAFVNTITSHLDNKMLPKALDVILKPINLYEPIIRYQHSEASDSTLFTLDLRDEHDFKLFMHAALLYLKHQQCVNNVLTPSLFQGFYPDKQIPASNMETLYESLGLKGVDLLVATYRLEQLVHFFHKSQYHDKQPTLDLEQMLGGTDTSFFEKKATLAPSGTLLAMKNIYVRTEHHQKPVHTYLIPETIDSKQTTSEQGRISPAIQTPWEKLSMFAQNHNDKNDQPASDNMHSKQTPAWFF